MYELDDKSKIELHFTFEYDAEKDRFRFSRGGGDYDAGVFTDQIMGRLNEYWIDLIACSVINEIYASLKDRQ